MSLQPFLSLSFPSVCRMNFTSFTSSNHLSRFLSFAFSSSYNSSRIGPCSNRNKRKKKEDSNNYCWALSVVSCTESSYSHSSLFFTGRKKAGFISWLAYMEFLGCLSRNFYILKVTSLSESRLVLLLILAEIRKQLIMHVSDSFTAQLVWSNS